MPSGVWGGRPEMIRGNYMTTIAKSFTSARYFAPWLCAAAAAVSIAGAPVAAADPAFPVAGNGPASDTINALQAQGYDVQINWLEGHPNVPLKECLVREIDDPNGPTAITSSPLTVYVDVTCPNAK
jgi:hypothetical protein